MDGENPNQDNLSKVTDMLEVMIESVQFDFAKKPDSPEAQVSLRVLNQSKYEVFVERINWHVTIGSKNTPSVSGSFAKAFLLLPQTSRNDLLLSAVLSYAEARYVSHSKEGLTASGHIEGILLGRVDQSVFEKKFLASHVYCLVKEEEKSLAGARFEPTHLDSLTSLLNRQFLKENMQIIVNTATSYKPVSFMMIDVDDFKKLNDQYGHLIGDDVLKVVASKMREVVKDKGFAIRYAGDEFCIILDNHDLADAKYLAEKLCSNIADYEFEISQGRLRLTVSIGVAGLKEKADYKDLIQRADDLLLLAKKSGKNRVIDQAR